MDTTGFLLTVVLPAANPPSLSGTAMVRPEIVIADNMGGVRESLWRLNSREAPRRPETAIAG